MKINIEVHEEMKEEEIRKLLDGFNGLREKQLKFQIQLKEMNMKLIL